MKKNSQIVTVYFWQTALIKQGTNNSLLKSDSSETFKPNVLNFNGMFFLCYIFSLFLGGNVVLLSYWCSVISWFIETDESF